MRVYDFGFVALQGQETRAAPQPVPSPKSIPVEPKGGGSAYASRHQAAEQRRRTRINERYPRCPWSQKNIQTPERTFPKHKGPPIEIMARPRVPVHFHDARNCESHSSSKPPDTSLTTQRRYCDQHLLNMHTPPWFDDSNTCGRPRTWCACTLAPPTEGTQPTFP